jgi:hypothetical protein
MLINQVRVMLTNNAKVTLIKQVRNLAGNKVIFTGIRNIGVLAITISVPKGLNRRVSLQISQ